MKLLFLLIFLGLSLITANYGRTFSGSVQKNFSKQPDFIYHNLEFAYTMTVLPNFTIDSSNSELATITSSDSRVRINSGCFESGTEGLIAIPELVTINGIPALQEDFYKDQELILKRISVNDKQNKCFLLEEVAQTEQGWQELLTMRKTFRFDN
ncbi:MAG: hypothetical protein KW793_02395 [Candidatus Doudnabacteria bacterium]|nr:hypothetical protein [Candidatus Doudnabacteria bacterium]